MLRYGKSSLELRIVGVQIPRAVLIELAVHVVGVFLGYYRSLQMALKVPSDSLVSESIFESGDGAFVATVCRFQPFHVLRDTYLFIVTVLYVI